mgnify:CR=1 FL=1
MRQQVKQLKSLFQSATLVFLLASCANWTHIEYISPCVTNPDGDYKDLTTIIGKAECFSGDAIIEKPVTKAITDLPLPARYPVVAVYSFADLSLNNSDNAIDKDSISELKVFFSITLKSI